MMTASAASDQRDAAIAANLCAIRLTYSRHALDREGAPAAHEVAQLHHAAWLAMSGKTAPGVA